MLPLIASLQTSIARAKDRLSDEETGATAVEYGLIIGLIAVAIVAVLVLLGPNLANLFSSVNDQIPAVGTGTGGEVTG